MRRQLRTGLRIIKAAVGVALAGDPKGAVRWVSALLHGRRQIVSLVLYGYPIDVRPIVDDVASSLACFQREFATLPRIMPGGSHALIVDGGGFIGAAAIFFAVHYPSSRVVTVEPDPDNFEMLKRNVANFPTITPVHAALAPVKGKAILKDRGTGRYGHTIVEYPADAIAKIIGEVSTLSISDVCDMFAQYPVHIVKLDIEGGEKAVLADPQIARWLSRTACLCVELHDRIAPGSTDAFSKAVAGRTVVALGGEKLAAIKSDIPLPRI